MVATYKYKQPRRLNAVSIVLFLILAAAVYVGISAWPVVSRYSNVHTEISDGLSQLYKANLLSEPSASQGVTSIKGQVTANLKKLGLADKHFDVFMRRDKKEVSIEAKYEDDLVLLGWGKKYKLTMNPHVKTDAARVQWE